MKLVVTVSLSIALSWRLSYAQDSRVDSDSIRRVGTPPDGYIEEVVPDEVGAAAARADEALMNELHREIEALPPDLTHQAGAEILRARVDEFQTLEARQRVLLSIANIYRHLGNKEEARRYYEEVAAIPSFDPHFPSMAKRELASMLSGEGRTDDALKVLREESGSRPRGNERDVKVEDATYPTQRNPGIDDKFMTLLAEAEVLQRAGRIEESLEILAQLEREWSSPMRLDLLVPVACISIVAADMQGRYEDELQLYDQLLDRIPVLRDREGLLSNRIMVARDAQKTDLATQLSEEYLLKYGDTRTATGHLSLMAGDAAARGEKELAAEYYNRIITHPRATAGYIETAKLNLAQLRSRGMPLGHTPARPELQVRESWRPFILVNIGLFAVVVGILVFLRYRARRSRG